MDLGCTRKEISLSVALFQKKMPPPGHMTASVTTKKNHNPERGCWILCSGPSEGEPISMALQKHLVLETPSTDPVSGTPLKRILPSGPLQGDPTSKRQPESLGIQPSSSSIRIPSHPVYTALLPSNPLQPFDSKEFLDHGSQSPGNLKLREPAWAQLPASRATFSASRDCNRTPLSICLSVYINTHNYVYTYPLSICLSVYINIHNYVYRYRNTCTYTLACGVWLFRPGMKVTVIPN